MNSWEQFRVPPDQIELHAAARIKPSKPWDRWDWSFVGIGISLICMAAYGLWELFR